MNCYASYDSECIKVMFGLRVEFLFTKQNMLLSPPSAYNDKFF